MSTHIIQLNYSFNVRQKTQNRNYVPAFGLSVAVKSAATHSVIILQDIWRDPQVVLLTYQKTKLKAIKKETIQENLSLLMFVKISKYSAADK